MNKLPCAPPLLQWFREAATPILAQRFNARRCLPSTRICIEVMQKFNLRAVPVSVHTEARNPFLVRELDKLGRSPTAKEAAAWGPEACVIRIDTTPQPDDDENDRFPGHVVAVVLDWLVDAAAVQFCRPDLSLHVPDVLVAGPLPPDFLKGKETVVFRSTDQAELLYKVRTEDLSYGLTPGFLATELDREIASQIYEHMLVLKRKAFAGTCDTVRR